MKYAFLSGSFLPDLPIEEYAWVIHNELKRIIGEDPGAHFYVAMKCGLDIIAQGVMSIVRSEYPQVKCEVVLPRPETDGLRPELPFLIPDELREEDLFVCKAFMTDRWMIRNADAVVCIAEEDDDITQESLRAALREGKKVVNLIDKVRNK